MAMIIAVGKADVPYALVDLGLRLAISSVSRSHASPRPALMLSAADFSLDEPSRVIEQVRQFYEEDDVFDEAFLSDTVIVADVSPSARRAMLLRTELADEVVVQGKHWDLDKVESVDTFGFHGSVLSGPVFIVGETILHAYRIYTDSFACFQTTVLPTRVPYRFKNLDSIGPNGSGMSVAVPSRGYGPSSPAKPLRRYRVAVKDNFKLSGLKTSLGNRSFLATYEEDHETAAFVKKIIDSGSSVLGKTKMTAFASGEKAIDWFDFQCPFSPRGDGYLEPGSSSTGSAAAAAAYPWIDVLIGTDTNGSVREPAARCGVYGIRFSTDLWGSTAGLYPCSPVFDSVGGLARKLPTLRSFSQVVLHPAVKEFRKFPGKILYPTDFFPLKDATQQQLVDHFIHILEKFLGVQKSSFSLAETWVKNAPREAEGRSLQEYAYKSGYNPFYYDMYHEYDEFRDDHVKKFGTEAYVSPSMQWRWDRGAEITESEVEQSHRELKVLQSWFAENVLRADKSSGSTAILILPVGPTEPNYRDAYVLPGPRLGIDALSLASFMRMPQIVIPVGQVNYESRVSGRIESLPVCSSIAGAHGSDLMLLDLAVKALEKANFPTEVKTGRHSFRVD